MSLKLRNDSPGIIKTGGPKEIQMLSVKVVATFWPEGAFVVETPPTPNRGFCCD
jgi:hypothetical protein